MFSGGTRGPALRVYPTKTWGQGEAHYLLLPPELAGWLEEWIALNEWQIGQADTPMFPGQNRAKSLTPNSFYTAISGDRRDGGRALLPYGGDPYDGWHPHAFRHSSIQASVQAALAFKADHPHRLGHVHPEEFAAAIDGHKLATSISATYRDLDREELVCAVMPYKWALLWDEGVLHRGIDVDRVPASEARYCESPSPRSTATSAR
jgi:integrase